MSLFSNIFKKPKPPVQKDSSLDKLIEIGARVTHQQRRTDLLCSLLSDIAAQNSVSSEQARIVAVVYAHALASGAPPSLATDDLRTLSIVCRETVSTLSAEAQAKYVSLLPSVD